jgi:hypothetical protein
MKRIDKIIITAALTMLVNLSVAQNINWKSLEPSEKHILNLNMGFDNSTSIGVGYGYHFDTKMPLLLNIEYSLPFGDKAFDDSKLKIGGQLNVLRLDNFYTTVKAYGIIRRYENELARLLNFGSEFSASAGYYRKKWYAVGEFGFDKAIVTHIKHSDLMKQYNPDLESGWYIPTGGNFFYGLQTGYSFDKNEVYAKVGRVLTQDFKTTPLVPYYFQVGWNMKWGD